MRWTLALSLMTVTAMAAPKAPPPELLKAAEARASAAEERIKLLDLEFQRGAASLDQVLAASRSWFLAYREGPFPAAKVVEVAQTYRDHASQRLKLGEQRFKMGALSQSDLAGLRYDVAEAEFWVQEAKWKLASP
jgi:outer membrane protein TolC